MQGLDHLVCSDKILYLGKGDGVFQDHGKGLGALEITRGMGSSRSWSQRLRRGRACGGVRGRGSGGL